MMKIVSLLILLVFPIYAGAGTYYASPSGTGTWSGSMNIATPCSANTAVSSAVAGDTVYFRGGTYQLGQSDNNQQGSGCLYPLNSGTSNTNRIIFRAYIGETPVLNTTVDGQIVSRAWGDRGRDYTTLSGFAISSTGDSYCGSVGVGDGSVGTVIEYCNFIGAATPGTNTDNISGVAFEGSTYAKVDNCTFINYRDSADSHNTSAIKLYNADYLTVSRCEFRNSTVAIYNKISSNYNNYTNNFFYNSSTHILVNVDGVGDMAHGVISNNTMVNGAYSSITLEQIDSNYTPDWTISNNTIYNSNATDRVVSINNSTGRYVYNNIFMGYSLSGLIRYVAGATVDRSDHNLYASAGPIIYRDGTAYTLAGWQSSAGLESAYDYGCGLSPNPGCGSIHNNPIFANGTGALSEIADFALSATSPGYQAGSDGCDIGADVSKVGVQTEYENPVITITTPDDFSTLNSSAEIEGTYTVDLDLPDQSVVVIWTLGEASGFAVAALGVFSCTVPVELGANSVVFRVVDSIEGEDSDITVVTRTPPPSSGNVIYTGSMSGGTYR